MLAYPILQIYLKENLITVENAVILKNIKPQQLGPGVNSVRLSVLPFFFSFILSVLFVTLVQFTSKCFW